MLDDLKKSLLDMDRVEAGFLAQQISRIMEKNKYKLLIDRNGELTSLGEIVAQIYELVFAYGVLKYEAQKGDADDE